MKTSALLRLATVALLAVTLVTRAADDPADQVRALFKEAQGAMQALTTKYRAAKTEEERAALIKQNPAPQYAAKFLELGEKLGKDPAAAEALVYVAQFNPTGADASKAFDLLARDHINSPRVLLLINMLPRLESESGNRLLKAIAEKSTEPSLKTAAQKALDQMAKQADFAIGKVAPEITGEDLNGKPIKISDFRGKIVVIDFWGDW